MPDYLPRIRALWESIGRPHLGQEGASAIAEFRRLCAQMLFYGTDGEGRDQSIGEWYKAHTPPHDRDVNKLCWKMPGGRGVVFADIWRMHDVMAFEPRWLTSPFPEDDQTNWRQPPQPTGEPEPLDPLEARIILLEQRLELAEAALDGVLRYGSRVGLFTEGGYVVCAEGGGGGEVNATRRQILGWETFTIGRP